MKRAWEQRVRESDQAEQPGPPVGVVGLNGDAGRRGAQAVVWPELAGMDCAPAGQTQPLRALATRSDQPPFVTSFQDDHGPMPHNAAGPLCL